MLDKFTTIKTKMIKQSFKIIFGKNGLYYIYVKTNDFKKLKETLKRELLK